jgi:hypothetical protein
MKVRTSQTLGLGGKVSPCHTHLGMDTNKHKKNHAKNTAVHADSTMFLTTCADVKLQIPKST